MALRSRLPIWTALLLLPLACAPRSVATWDDAVSEGHPIVLFTFEGANEVKPNFPLDLIWVEVADAQGAIRKHRLKPIPKGIGASIAEAQRPLEPRHAFFSAAPGQHRIIKLYGEARARVGDGIEEGLGAGARIGSGTSAGTFSFPVALPFDVSNGEIVYLGRLIAVNRTPASGEDPSTAAAPILGQVASGLWGGTLELRVTDTWEQDRNAFVARYPALAAESVTKRVVAR